MKQIRPNASRLARGALLGVVCLAALALSSVPDLPPPTGIEFRDVFVDSQGQVLISNLEPTGRLEFRPEFIADDGSVATSSLAVAPGLITPDPFIGSDGEVTQSTLTQTVPGLVFTELRISDDGTVLTPTVQPPDGIEFPPIFIGPDGNPVGPTPAPPSTPKRLLELDGAWPNPFNPALEIHFRLNRASVVRASVYDMRGVLVRTLLETELPADLHVLHWDGRDAKGSAVASGSYLIRVRAGSEEYSTRAVLVK
jgi:FlgD Ig-like domain